MRRSAYKEFAVIVFSSREVRGCRFRAEGGAIRLAAFETAELDANDPVRAWKTVIRSIAYNRGTPLFISGALAKGIFFRCTSARLAPKALRSALEFDLPTHLLKEPEQCRSEEVV